MINCIHSIHNHAPFEQGSEKGVNASMVKRAIIGLIFAAAVTVGTYYLSMAVNIWNFPPNVHFGFAIAGASMLGVIGLLTTGAWVFTAKMEALKMKAQSDLQTNLSEDSPQLD